MISRCHSITADETSGVATSGLASPPDSLPCDRADMTGGTKARIKVVIERDQVQRHGEKGVKVCSLLFPQSCWSLDAGAPRNLRVRCASAKGHPSTARSKARPQSPPLRHEAQNQRTRHHARRAFRIRIPTAGALRVPHRLRPREGLRQSRRVSALVASHDVSESEGRCVCEEILKCVISAKGKPGELRPKVKG